MSSSTVTLLVASLTASVTMLGRFATEALERRQKRADSRRMYIQKQIEEFYGLLLEQHRARTERPMLSHRPFGVAALGR